MNYQNVQNVLIQPMRVILGSDVKQVQKLTCRADVTLDLAGKYFVAHTPTENHIFWLDGGDADAPAAVTGWVIHAVALVANDSATAIATKIAAVVNGLTGKFTAVATGKTVMITCATIGYAHPMRDARLTADQTGFAFQMMTMGFAEVSAGAIKDTIEISGMTSKTKAITTHATGETEQGEIVTGFDKPQVKFSMYEFDKEAIKKALRMSGGNTMLPEVEGAQVLVGYGTGAMGGSKTTLKTRLHPVALDDSDKSEDWHFWKSAYSLESFTFSGVEFSEIPVTASIYPDSAKPKDFQFYAIGDLSAMGW